MRVQEKLFVPHSEEDGERKLEIIRSTIRDDCAYEVKNTGGCWEGWDGALRFYKSFLLRREVGTTDGRDRPAGHPLDVADMTATQQILFGRYRSGQWTGATGVVIYFPWNPDHKKFEGETIYSIRPLQS